MAIDLETVSAIFVIAVWSVCCVALGFTWGRIHEFKSEFAKASRRIEARGTELDAAIARGCRHTDGGI